MKDVSENARYVNFSLCLLVFIWIIGWFFTAVGLERSTPFSFSALRFLLAALVMHLMIYVGSRYVRYTLFEWVAIILVGLFQTTIMFSLASYGINEVGLAKAAILIYSTPVWNIILGWFFLRKRLSAFKVLGVFFASVGIFLIALPGLANGAGIGAILLLGSSLSWSISSLILKTKLATKDMVCITAWQMTFGSIGLVALAFYSDGRIIFDVALDSIVALVYVSIVASVIAFTLWSNIVSRVDLVRSSMATLMVPVSVLVVQEVRTSQYVDFVLVTASIFIILGLIMVIVGGDDA